MPLPFKKNEQIVGIASGSILLLGAILLGLFLFRFSETGNQFIFGVSLTRLVAGLAFACLLIIPGVFFISMFKPLSVSKKIQKWLNLLFSTKNNLLIFFTGTYGTALFLAGLLIAYSFPTIKSSEFIMGVIKSSHYPILWLEATTIIYGFLALHLYKDKLSFKEAPALLKLVWFSMPAIFYILLVFYFRKVTYALYLKNFEIPLLWVLGFYFVWATAITFVNQIISEKINRVLLPIGIFLSIFVLYQQMAIWSGQFHQSKYEYWDSLALQFTNGKLYLADSSIRNFTTHDLTLYDGKWYVPIPPLPAILLMPVVTFLKPENLYMGDVSMLMAALNVLLMYLILKRLTAQKWVQLSQGTILLLLSLFAFGTNHLWVGIMGDVWFVSQMATVTFISLAVLASLWNASPWITGVLIGVAMLARPNSLMSWPFALGIAMQIKIDREKTVNFSNASKWALSSAIPIGMAVTGILAYNYARFNNFLDFGYVNISGEATIVKNAQAYGLFSPHYILNNLKVMLFGLPKMDMRGMWLIQPSLEGMSIFISTPALFYLFRSYENKWWVLGAWTSVILGTSLLAMYHNTGAAQFGYRYILDIILPIMALLPISIQKKIPLLFYVFFLASIVMNIYGSFWFVNAH